MDPTFLASGGVPAGVWSSCLVLGAGHKPAPAGARHPSTSLKILPHPGVWVCRTPQAGFNP